MKIQQQTRSSTGSGSQHYTKITESMMKKFCVREIFFALYHLARIGLSIAIIILIIQTDLKNTKSNNYYLRTQQILNLWSKNVIVDMITVSSYNCPKGYESYSSALWHGTKEGCYCVVNLGTYDYGHIIPGQCSLKLINLGCTRVSPQQAIPFAFWKPHQLICVKRINGLNFFTNVSKYLQPKQIKKCSTNTNFQMFSLAAEKCPITAISNRSIDYPNILKDINFSFTRQTSYPIIDLRMSQYSFCLEYNRSNISPNRFKNYNLQTIKIQNCQEDNDPRVKQIDSITEKQLFVANKRIDDIITFVLPLFPHPTEDYVYKLGTVQYPPWTLNCRQSQDYNLTAAKKNFQFDDIIDNAYKSLTLTVSFVCVYGFLNSIIMIFKRIIQVRSRYKNGILFYPDSIVLRIDPNLISNQLRLSLFCQTVLFCFLLLLALALLIQIGLQYNETINSEKWFRTSYACMDGSEYFQNWVQKGYVVILQENIKSYLICLLATLVIVCLDCIFMIWRCNKGDLADVQFNDFIGNQDNEKNSDENIQVDEENEKQMYVKDEKGMVEDIEQENNVNYLKERQKTGDFQKDNIRMIETQNGSNQDNLFKTGFKHKKKRNQRQQREKFNQTEESFQGVGVDDLSFKRINIQEFKNKDPKAKRPLRNSKNLSFDD